MSDTERVAGSAGGGRRTRPPFEYVVGRLYNPARTRWPEMAQWRLSDDTAELLIFLASPTSDEIDAVRSGEARFALLAGEHAMVVAHRFDPMPWSDTPWQACRQTDATAGLPDVGPAERLVVAVILIDADSGVVCATRTVTWPARMVALVRAAIRGQVLNQSTDAQGAAEIEAWYSRYPTTAKLVHAADVNIAGQ